MVGRRSLSANQPPKFRFGSAVGITGLALDALAIEHDNLAAPRPRISFKASSA
jgi:hypothetical protein